MAQMSLGQWRKRLGDAVALDDAPKQLGIPSMQVLRAVNTGKVPLHTFRAADGRVFRMVRTRDLERYTAQPTQQPVITMQGMKAAFREMTEAV